MKILNCKSRDDRAKTGAPGGVHSLTRIRKKFKNLLLKNYINGTV